MNILGKELIAIDFLIAQFHSKKKHDCYKSLKDMMPTAHDLDDQPILLIL